MACPHNNDFNYGLFTNRRVRQQFFRLKLREQDRDPDPIAHASSEFPTPSNQRMDTDTPGVCLRLR